MDEHPALVVDRLMAAAWNEFGQAAWNEFGQTALDHGRLILGPESLALLWRNVHHGRISPNDGEGGTFHTNHGPILYDVSHTRPRHHVMVLYTSPDNRVHTWGATLSEGRTDD